MKSETALLELSILNAETHSSSFSDMAVVALNRGIPPEIITRLKNLWDETKIVAGETIQIGKIIVSKIISYIQKNQRLAIGIAIGIALGALVSMIPLIGGLLAPLATIVAASYGALTGYQLDKGKKADTAMSKAIEIAHEFFALFADILSAVEAFWVEKQSG